MQYTSHFGEITNENSLSYRNINREILQICEKYRQICGKTRENTWKSL